jgi:hypothetical protein
LIPKGLLSAVVQQGDERVRKRLKRKDEKDEVMAQ